MWGKVNLKKTTILHYVTGSKELWIKRTETGITLLLQDHRNALGFSCEELDDLHELPTEENLKTYYLPGNTDAINILPKAPDKPIILNADRKIIILPEHKSLFLVKIPVFIQLSTTTKEEATILKYSSVKISNAWFGCKFKGNLCYTVASDFTHEVNIQDDIGSYIVCPLEIENCSKGIFSFDKIYFEVENLNIYKGASYLWSNPCKIEYLNEDGIGKLVYFDKVPGFDNADKIIYRGRNGIKKTVWKIKQIVQQENS